MTSRRIQLAFAGVPTAFRRGIERAATDLGVLADDGVLVTLVPLAVDPDSCHRLDDLIALGPVVALLDHVSPSTIRHAMSHGAACADLEGEPEAVVAAAIAAADGTVVLPVALLRALADSDAHAAARVTDEERLWLADLARGTTVVRLADEYGYSERAMFRRLADLYGRLGARNRDEAVTTAQRAGLLDG